MTDKEFTLFGISAAVLLAWYWFAHRQTGTADVAPAESPALPMAWDNPMNTVYSANPSAFQPASPPDLSINIANQSASLLNQQYIPLFGFVGMAQGALYG